MIATQTAIQNPLDLKQYSALYKQELLQNILPFWLKHSKDEVNGGYFTCLDRTGNVYDTDKFIWLQGREVWCFSYMYHHVEAKEEWLEMARQGAAFLEKYGRDEKGNWYFSLTAEGKPLVQPYNIFSDCFATMAFAALDKASPNELYKKISLDTFENILKRQHSSKGVYTKAFPATRPLKNFSLPMILCNLPLELEHIIGTERVNSFIPTVIHEVMNVFYQPQLRLIMENVNQDETFSDSFEGRLLNPGHVIEAMWFIMDLGKRLNEEALIKKACNIMLDTIEYGGTKNMTVFFTFLM